METSSTNSDPYTNSSSSSSNTTNSATLGIRFPSLNFNFFHSPLSFLLDHSGILRTHQETTADSLTVNQLRSRSLNRNHSSSRSAAASVSESGEIAIRIIGAGDQDSATASSPSRAHLVGEACSDQDGGGVAVLDDQTDSSNEERVPLVNNDSSLTGRSGVSRDGGNSFGELEDDGGVRDRDSAYQRYDIQQVARWIEQILPFSLLLLAVFIRQHLQGFFVTLWISAVMYKSNDIVRKQTALKGERRISVLAVISVSFLIHVVGIYWWFGSDDLLYPFAMLPPKVIPPFWHAVFIVLVNDTMVRQAAMAFKCLLLMYYRNGRGHSFRRQGQLLTLVEYTLLLYRALLPTPVWYRFFLNKEYGSLFSSLTTGLYLTFKLTSVVEKIKSFFAALKALSRKEVHYGSSATSEQVIAAGELCAICQEKMHTPILLRCKHIFCEDCVSEWFERERTCPLCRALVKPADLRTFGDGSTNLLFQLF